MTEYPETNETTASDAGRFFQYMAEFVRLSERDKVAIKDTRFVVEKHLPQIVGDFYAHLLRYPQTRRFFLKKDGTIDQDYLELRMYHQVNFWRRTASAKFDDEYADFVEYVGKAHTSHGADPNIYIAERYVIAMVGFVQNAIIQALQEDLGEVDPELHKRGVRAWNKLLIVLLEILSRAYGYGRDDESYQDQVDYDEDAIKGLSVDLYERALGIARSVEYHDVHVGRVDEIPEGERKIIEYQGLSIGVFHHQGGWYALSNKCLHRSGPVCTGPLDGDTLTCPWHGYQYNLITGQMLLDSETSLPSYPVEIRGEEVYICIQVLGREKFELGEGEPPAQADGMQALAGNEFLLSDFQPGGIKLVYVDGEPVAVYHVDGDFYATHNLCTHADGPLNEGDLEGTQVVCPWHGSCFDVTSGDVLCGPAVEPVAIFDVILDGEIGRVVAG
jgi:nitrite reductase/ring-hydroxylating ferredoxin subunit